MSKMKKAFTLMALSTMATTSFSTYANPTHPSDIADFSTWKLQLPIANDAKTSVKEIPSTELMDGYDDGKYFYLEDNAVVLHSPVDGFKTANTNYTRSELREMLDGKSKTSNWSFNGTHTLNTTQSVSEIPSNGRVVVSQIHSIYPNGDNGPALVKVEYDGSTKQIVVMYKSNTAPNAADIRFYFGDVELNQIFDTELKIVDGVVYTTISSEGRTKEFTYDFMETDPNWSTYLNYFKVGSYVQDSIIDYEGEAGTVEVYKMETFHDENYVEDVKIENLSLERDNITLDIGETSSLIPIFTPIDTLNKKVNYEVISGNEYIAVNNQGIVTAIKEGTGVVCATSLDNPSIKINCTISVEDIPEQEVIPIYEQDFGLTEPVDLTNPEFLISEGGTTQVEIKNEEGNNILTVTDSDVKGSGKFLTYFPPQHDSVTISYKIRIDSIDVKDAGGPKAQSSYLYIHTGGKEGFLTSAEEMFRLRNAATYQAGELSNHRWVLTNGYLTPKINTDVANVELGEWVDVTIITTPNNGTANANTTDVYMNGVKIGHKIGNNNKDAEYVSQINLHSGTADLINFSVDDIKVYSGANIPQSSNSVLPTEIQKDIVAGTLGVSNSIQLQPSVLPVGSDERVTYASLTNDTIVVSNDGLVTAVNSGEGIIRVSSQTNPKVYSDYKFNIEDELKHVKEINLPNDNVSVNMGESLSLDATVYPLDASENGLKYEILKGSECLSVDNNGNVTPIQPGEATIRITSLDNVKIFRDCIVKVVSNNPVGTIIYEQDFSGKLDTDNWTTATSNINNTENVIKDGAFYFKDNSNGGQPKSYLTFTPQADTFTIEFKFKLDADTIYNDTKISALSSAFGTGSITSSANEAFRFKTSGTIENNEVINKRFTYSKEANVSGFYSVPNNIEIGEWYTVAFTTTPDNGSPRANTTDIYINGEKLVSDAHNKLAMPTIDKFIFQTGTQDLTEYWIDDFKIWSGDYTDLQR